MFKKNIIKILITITLATLTLPITTTAMKNKTNLKSLLNNKNDNAIILETKKEQDEKTPESLDKSNETKEYDCENEPHYKIFPEELYKLKNVIGKDEVFLERLDKLEKKYIKSIPLKKSKYYHIYDKELTFHNVDGALEDIFEEHDKYVSSHYKYYLTDSEPEYSTKKNAEEEKEDEIKAYMKIFLKYLIFITKISSYAEEEFKTINEENFTEYKDEESIKDTINFLKNNIELTNNEIEKEEIENIIKDVKDSIKKQFKEIYKIIMTDKDRFSYEGYGNILNPTYFMDFLDEQNKKITYLSLLKDFKNDNEKFIEQNKNLNNNNKNIFLYFMKEYLQTNKEICRNYIIWHLIKSKKFDVFDMLDKYKDYFKCHKKVTDGYCRSVAEVPISLIKKIVTTIQNLKNFQLK